ncbi:DUF2844 domain-containing protein [Xylophilus sp. Kf1]|nr:DUF2844 domain-containing protein [Xylophilus sp. Kf1]
MPVNPDFYCHGSMPESFRLASSRRSFSHRSPRTMDPSFRLPLAGLAIAACLVAPLPALATLGGDPASVEADRLAMAGIGQPVVQAAGHTVHAYRLPSGTVVREYLADSGRVFAVAWDGPFKPDLAQLLGARHFAAMDDSTRERNREGRRGPMSLRPAGAGHLAIESSGHMRAFVGRAWLSDQLPAGVDADAIR